MSMLPPKELQTHCPRCHTEMPITERLCGSCGLDREAYLAGEAFSGPALASARRWILAVAILMSIGTLMLYLQLGEYADQGIPDFESMRLYVMAPTAGVTLCFFGLWLWARKQPFAAAVVALALFVTVQLANGVMDPSSMLLHGIFFKVFVIAVLVGAVRAGFKARRIRAEYAGNNLPPARLRR